jgi:hypothetical protein
LKLARPDYRFPGEAFVKEDETRVRWLPEEKLLVLEPMASPFREIAKQAALNLMRMSEIRTLTREQVRLDRWTRGCWRCPSPRPSLGNVMLRALARKILQGQMENDVPACDCSAAEGAHEHVFPKPNGRSYSREQVGKAFRRPPRRWAAGFSLPRSPPPWRDHGPQQGFRASRRDRDAARCVE